MSFVRVFLVSAMSFTFAATVAAHTAPKEVTVKLICDLGEAREKGNYDWTHVVYDRAKAPKADCKDEEEATLRFFVSQEDNNSFQEMKDIIQNDQCEPVTWPYLLSLGAQYPEFQRDKHVVALGSIWHYTARQKGIKGMPMKLVSYLDADEEDGRNLGFDYPMTWGPGIYFPAICSK